MDEKDYKKGTTTVGLVGTDGIVLATESRATMGNLVANKNVQKVFEIQPHIGITVAGAVGDAQKLVRIMQVETSLYQIEREKPIKVNAAVSLLSNILQGTKHFPYYVQLLVGGFDTTPKLYSLDALGSAIPETVTSTGSGSPFAYGVLEELYKEGRTTSENVTIAIKSISAAMERDAFSGNGVNVITITKDGYKKIDLAKIKSK